MKGKYTFKDGRSYEGYFEDDKMTDSPTYNRSSVLSHEISKIKTRIPSGILTKLYFLFSKSSNLLISWDLKNKAGTTLNIQMLRANKETNRSDFHLVLEINSILNDFDSTEKRSVESIQV